MLLHTLDPIAPWYGVRANHKKRVRKAIIRHLLRELAPAEVSREAGSPDPDALFAFEVTAVADGRLATWSPDGFRRTPAAPGRSVPPVCRMDALD